MNWVSISQKTAFFIVTAVETSNLIIKQVIPLTLKRGPGSTLLVELPRVLLRLAFRGLTQMFVDSRSPFPDMLSISAE
jgi:hypothetical protein